MTAERRADRVAETFAKARSGGRAAFVSYLVAGYPTPAVAEDAALAAVTAGADMLEIGVPFSDPMADGPTIAAASRAALGAGDGLKAAVQLAGNLRARGIRQPLMAMSYLNPLLAHGTSDALTDLVEAGVDGLIVPDLPVDEDPSFERLAAAKGLRIAFLVAPNSTEYRIRRAVAASTAFVYVVPLFGVTGTRDALADGAVDIVGRVRHLAEGRIPVVAGFGISNAAQVSQLAEVADGVVVGSALVRALADGNGNGVSRLGALVSELSGATRRSADAGRRPQ